MSCNSVRNHTRDLTNWTPANRTTAKRESDLLITSMSTDRIGRHDVLLPILIIYVKTFLYFDWLRAVQFFFFRKQRRKELIQCKKKKQTKHSDCSMIKETHIWSIKSFVFKSNARPGWRNWWRNFSLIA